MSREFVKAPTPKQRIVLQELDKGRTFWQACQAADLSISDENRNAMLRRLLDNGYIEIRVTAGARAHLKEDS